MKKALSKLPSPKNWFALLAGLLLTVSMAYGQQTVSGQITDENNDPIPGVNVIIQGTTAGTVTDAFGNYSINASSNDVLVFSFVGYVTQEIPVGNQTTINVSLATDVQQLQEVVVTGYTSERKADIIGSVGVIDTKAALTTPSANLSQQLQGRAAGVTVSGDGAPGEGAKVRIRGFTSFGNSNPLYIIDGVPTKDPGTVNPSDIESMQVLKDATAASIYGARAAQGVIIITTKSGKSGKMQISYDGYYGTTKVPERSYLDVINTEQYLDYLQRTNTPDYIHPVFGQMSSATIPDRIVSSPGFKGGVSASDPRADPALYDISDFGAAYQIMETSRGTDWFDEMLRNGPIQNHQITTTGGTENATYSLSFNYFSQDGAFENTGYKRYSARLNTSFKPTKWLRVGENLQVINEESTGNRSRGEGGPWGWAYRFVPYIPARDIGGGFGGNSVGQSGNASNPVAVLARDADDIRKNWRIFGNAFAEVEPIAGLAIRTSFGVDYANFFNEDYNYRSYENSENRSITSYGVNNNNNVSWTWTNTATYAKTFAEKHSFKALVGMEAIQFSGYGLGVATNTFDFDDPVFINLNTAQFPTPNAYSYEPIRESLYSVFGRVDYTYNDKYLFNATIRRDGTSKIAKENRFGTFPAFGVGWRISEESFMSGIDWIDDLKLRGGWGQMGSIDNVNAGNQFTLFGSNIGTSFYDINRTNNSGVVGYTPYRSGSLETVWEFSETTNIGLDATFLTGKLELSIDWYKNNTNDLLVSRVPTGIEPQVFQPAINLGQMVNKGIDIALTNRNRYGDFSYDATLIFSHYKNEVTDIDGNPETFLSRNGDRLSDIVRTKSGQPVSSFWGYEIDPDDRFFDDQSELDELDQDGAVIGSWKYVDQDGNGVIDGNDQTWLGSPHPDFVTSLNLDMRWRNFDFNIFIIWNKGNELFNNVKYFTDMRVFVGGVSDRVINNDWRPGQDNSGATHPRLAPGAENGYTPLTTSTSNSFYVEDGSFLRGRTVQLGYNFSNSLLSRAGISNARIYFQAQNFFTITDYSGADPDINIQGGDDLLMGVDRGGFPSLAQYLIGVNISL
ncbi:SusC/RagA family TonB-linked outer membrane protein [Fulvivirga sedimenti]|uniref:TonB-dependent receptor n=1 Tax=Fulvivirga sedimenti TaxID=2879465 RepID=A0A9X1L1K0_9BACT|nr:TonB-dependent receptor [Fulvivirga sedimenti]MCA6078919.1 TonB-dependent receptor [Fulvivirga sedimenti]